MKRDGRNPTARSATSAITVGLTMAMLLGLLACAAPPRAPSGHVEPDRDLPSSDSETPGAIEDQEATTYDFEAEGAFPPPDDDVQFEEDLLPAPESVEGEALDTAPVEAEDLDTVPPAIETPVAPSFEAPLAPTRTIPAPQQELVRGRRGWRVQLAAVAQQTEADKIAREAKNRLMLEVHIVFESPYFKVRAGDFSDRADAVRLKERARAQGYPQAWLLATEIEPETP
jgi:SPOR domain